MKKITDFVECPHCGSELGYYQRVRYKGTYNDNRLFGTNEPYNMHMYDNCSDIDAMEEYVKNNKRKAPLIKSRN